MTRSRLHQYALALAISVILAVYAVALFALFIASPPAAAAAGLLMVLVIVWLDRTS